MRPLKLAAVVVGVIAVLHCLGPQAGAGGGGVAGCETTHPSGPPIRITFVTNNVSLSGTSVTVSPLTVLATFRGETLGPFTVSGTVPALSAMDAGCNVFNDLGESTLSSQILSAFGLPGSTLNFTACSFLGASDPSCDANPGLHAPLGWTAGVITGYAAR